jgi:hypothetical protein
VPITLKQFVRKPFSVQAVEVTAENMAEVAGWCGGQLRTSVGKNGQGVQSYIKVRVKYPLKDRQTMAYVGDWVVTALDQSGQSFKVYTPKAFEMSFDELEKDLMDTLARMDERAVREDKLEEDGVFPEELTYSNDARI